MNATVASSSEIWPDALALLDVSAMRLLTLRMPEAPQGDQMTDAVGTWSCFVYTWPSTQRPPPSMEVRVVVLFVLVSAYLYRIFAYSCGEKGGVGKGGEGINSQ